MFSYKISRNFWYSLNNTTAVWGLGNTLKVYALSPLKILWDFSVVCLNVPKFSSLEFNPQLCTVAKPLVPYSLNLAQPYVYRKALTETHRQPVRPILSVYPLGCDAPVWS